MPPSAPATAKKPQPGWGTNRRLGAAVGLVAMCVAAAIGATITVSKYSEHRTLLMAEAVGTFRDSSGSLASYLQGSLASTLKQRNEIISSLEAVGDQLTVQQFR